MAQAALSQDDLKVLERMRQQLFQLSNNIASVKGDVQRSNPLPPWPSIQNSASILAGNVEKITSLLSSNSDLLSRTVVYPSTNYPGRTQEGLLGQLLRKKLEPHVETWVEEGRSIQAERNTGTSDQDEEQLLKDATEWLGGRIASYIGNEAGDNYTVDERAAGVENVRTGLRRKLDDDSDEEDEDEDEDEDMEDAGVQVTSARRSSLGAVEFDLSKIKKDPNGKTRSIEDILRFATSGVVVEQPFSGRR